jgi:hypothetical protein
MYTKHRHELSLARKARTGTLVDPFLISGVATPAAGGGGRGGGVLNKNVLINEDYVNLKTYT